jgi:hypothetical protein
MQRVEDQQEQHYACAERVIGALALDIRENWAYGVKDRIRKMKTIAFKFEVLLPYVNEESACEDGRWFSKCWDGPYGPCSYADLGVVNETENIFLEPEAVISDHIGEVD